MATVPWTAPKTAVFWDVEDFPIPPGRSLDSLCKDIDSALQKNGVCTGGVSVTAYGEKKPEEELLRYKEAGISFVPRGDKYKRLKEIILDMFIWSVDHAEHYGYPKKVMIISKDMSVGETDLVICLQELSAISFDIFLVVPEDYIPTPGSWWVNAIWQWEDLLDGKDASIWYGARAPQ